MKLLENIFYSFIKQPLLVEGNFAIGGAGAVGTVKGDGIVSVTHGATGVYTIQFNTDIDASRFLQQSSNWIYNGDSNIVAIHIKQDPTTFQATFKSAKTLVINCLSSSGTPADPASGHVIGFTALLRRSSVGYT